MLHKMKNRNSICPAAWTLVGSVAVNCRNRSQALLVWALCQVKQKTIPARIPLNLTTKQCSVLKGFFTSIVAVLHTIASAKVGGVELTDERNHVSAGRGRGVISQDAQDVGVKGLNHSATVSNARAVADADSSEPTIKLHAGTANRTVSRIGFNPTPALGRVSPK